MDDLLLVGQILSECLTTEILQKHYLSWHIGNGGKVFGGKRGEKQTFRGTLGTRGGGIERETKPGIDIG
jgi:hypothetical protein